MQVTACLCASGQNRGPAAKGIKLRGGRACFHDVANLDGASVQAFAPLLLKSRGLWAGVVCLAARSSERPWSQASSFYAQARFIMSSAAQEELELLLTSSQMTSLDAEREHWQSKRGEGRRGVPATSLARAARNNILRLYLSERRKVVDGHLADDAKSRKLLKMNSWALAVEDNPELFPRGRGQLNESPVPKNIHAVGGQGCTAHPPFSQRA